MGTSDELRRLLKNATGRPWQVTDALHFGLAYSVIDARGNCIAPCRELAQDADKHNACLIVAAVNALPELLDAAAERDSLRAEVARLREALLETRRIGAQLANIAYNLAQRETLDEQARSSCDSTRRAWDALPKPAALEDADGG